MRAFTLKMHKIYICNKTESLYLIMGTKNIFSNNFGVQAGEMNIDQLNINNGEPKQKKHQENQTQSHKDFDCFISFSTQDEELAKFIKKVINKYFNPAIKVFVAGDGESISAGKKWADELKNALNDVTLFIVLLTPENIKQPWINLEFGAAWAKDIEILPICFNGLKSETLPTPFSYYQAVEIPKNINQLFYSLTKKFKLPSPSNQKLEKWTLKVIKKFKNHDKNKIKKGIKS